MARHETAAILVASLLLLCSSAEGVADDEQDSPFANLDDIKYIRCQACDAFVYHALGHVTVEREALKKVGKRLTEDLTMDILESMCEPKTEAGRWLKHLDIVEAGDNLRLHFMSKGLKYCNIECRTIVKACEQVQDSVDLNAMSELIFKGGITREEMRQAVCFNSITNFCAKPPPVPKDRKPGPVFDGPSQPIPGGAIFDGPSQPIPGGATAEDPAAGEAQAQEDGLKSEL